MIVEFVGGPLDGTQAEFKVLPLVYFVKEPPSVYRFSRLRPSGIYEYLHASLIEKRPFNSPPDFS